MLETFLHSGRDTILYGIPALGLLVIGVFGLEETLIRPKGGAAQPRRATRLDANGEPLLTDPDGRPVGRVRKG